MSSDIAPHSYPSHARQHTSKTYMHEAHAPQSNKRTPPVQTPRCYLSLISVRIEAPTVNLPFRESSQYTRTIYTTHTTDCTFCLLAYCLYTIHKHVNLARRYQLISSHVSSSTIFSKLNPLPTQQNDLDLLACILPPVPAFIPQILQPH
jgi:hypothetical protein